MQARANCEAARKTLSENDPRCHRSKFIHTLVNLKICFIAFCRRQKGWTHRAYK